MSAESPASTPHTTPLATQDLASSADARFPHHRAYLLIGHRDQVVTAPLDPGTNIVIGREIPADIVIPDKGVSRLHTRFSLSAEGEILVQDLGSTNGTKVAGKRVQSAILKPGDEVLLGPIPVSVHIVGEHDPPPLGLLHHETFLTLLDAEIARVKFFQRVFTLVMVRPLHNGSNPLVTWAPRIQQILRPVDTVAVYGANVLEILLPESPREQSIAIARAITTPPSVGPSLICGVAFFPGASSAEELVSITLSALRKTTLSQPVHIAGSDGHKTLPPNRDPEKIDAIVMESSVMQEVDRTASRLANAVIPVLIHGETGTGKEVFARIIHDRGHRREKPFVAVNCGAIPKELLESTLFGHEKGAFTGAVQQQKGLFEVAEGGTILLDEIGELPAAAQAALLRVLEDKRIRRVGSAREIDLDVRVIAATHRDLDAMAAKGDFRSDLFFRLNAMEVTLPPLRARRVDIPKLAIHFLQKAAKANDRDVRVIGSEAMTLLEGYSWPGNVRELRNALERAVVVAEGDTITPFDLPTRMHHVKNASDSTRVPSRFVGSWRSRMERFERETLLEALRETQNNQSEAARLLDLPLRTLQHKVNTLGIKRKLEHGPDDAKE
jgi:transcriptional regulator with PAS, ATPase and Fis domain